MGIRNATLIVGGLLSGVAFAGPTQSASNAAPASMPPRSPGQSSNAAKFLFKALDHSRVVPMEAIIVRSGDSRNSTMMQIKVEQIRGGQVRLTVLGPLTNQGVVSVDDGKTWQTYLPDENRILEQPSPQRFRPPTSTRFALATANYSFQMAPADDIAGRSTILVTAQPKVAQMPKRWFYIDEEQLVTLRTEVQSGRERRITFDTKTIDFEPDLSREELVLEPLRPVRRIKLEGPIRYSDPNYAKGKVGFLPGNPKEVPFGFALTSNVILGTDDSAMVAARLSDGLASLTVYQFRSELLKSMGAEGRRGVSREVRGIRIQAVGDVPQAILAEILQVFVRELQKGLPPQAGIIDGGTALSVSIGGHAIQVTIEPVSQNRIETR